MENFMTKLMELPWGHLLDLYLLIFFFLFMRLIGLKIVLSNSNFYTIGAMLMIRSLFLNHMTIFYHFLITLILSILISLSHMRLKKINVFLFLMWNILFSNGKFSTTVYREPTFTGLFTNFESFIPITYKRGLINTLLLRYFNISSSYAIFHAEIEKFRQIMTKNGYPGKFFW